MRTHETLAHRYSRGDNGKDETEALKKLPRHRVPVN
jgi:hypothetical protein